MVELFRRSLAGQRIGLGAAAFGLFVISMIIVYTFEALGGVEAIEAFFELLPESIKALLRAQGGIATDAEGYLAADYRHPIYLVALGAFAIGSASGAVAREVERGTVFMLLAAPVPRWRFLAAKVGALLVGIVVVVAAALAGTFAGILLTGTEDVSFAVFLQVQVMTFMLGFAIGGIGLLVSSATSDGSQAMGVATAIIVVMYVVDFLAVLWETAEPLGPLSIFHYYDPLGVSRAGALDLGDLLVLAAVGLIGTTAAFAIFLRRDIK